MAREKSILPFLLWWTIFFLLWYAGSSMWIAAIVSFFTGWIFGRLLEWAGYRIINYSVTFKLPVMELPVEFQLPWHKRIFGTLLSRSRPTIKAEIRYRWDDMERWTFPVNGKWGDERAIWITVDQPMKTKLLIWERSPDEQHLQLNEQKTPLPNNFEVAIRLVNPNGRILWRNNIKYSRAT